MIKPPASTPVPDERWKSETTKCIVRCCEERKRREGQVPTPRDTQRIRIKLGN